MVEAVIYFDSFEPGAKRRTALESLEPKESLDEDFLGQILVVFFVASEVATVGQDSSLVALDELFEGTQVAFGRFEGSLKQVVVWIFQVIRYWLVYGRRVGRLSISQQGDHWAVEKVTSGMAQKSF